MLCSVCASALMWLPGGLIADVSQWGVCVERTEGMCV